MKNRTEQIYTCGKIQPLSIILQIHAIYYYLFIIYDLYIYLAIFVKSNSFAVHLSSGKIAYLIDFVLP